MKRVLGAVVAVAALAALPGAASAQDGPVMKRIAETKTITIGHRDASVPLSYLSADGKVQGYSVDICLKIADAAKEELKLDKPAEFAFSELSERVIQDLYRVLCATPTTETRTLLRQ